MAKAAHSFKNPNDYNEINKFLSGIDPEGDLLSGFDKTDIRGWYGTGNYMMNAHYSGSILKGAPLGRALVIAGDPKTGKSYFALEMAEELQKLGYFIQMYETEASPDTDRFIAQKINPNMFRKTPVKHIEKVIHWVAATNNQLLQIKKSGGTVPKIAYIIDSWNGLITEKDEQDAIKGELKSDMGHFAKLGKKLMNIYSVNGAILDQPMIITCHIYEKDMKGFRQRTVSGGNGPLYFASIIPMLSKKKVNEKEKNESGDVTKVIPTGVMITSKLLESRYAKTTSCDIYLDFKKGINPYYGLLDHCSWNVCGIDKGAVVNSTDFAGLLVAGKKVTKDTIVGFNCSPSFLEKTLSKSAWGTNGSSVLGTLEYFISTGYVERSSEDGICTFTDKILERFDETGKYKKFEDKVTVVGKTYSNYVCKHLPGELFSAATIHQSKVFTQDVLEKLDEVIRPLYEYGDDGAPEISDTQSLEEEMFSTGE